MSAPESALRRSQGSGAVAHRSKRRGGRLVAVLLTAVLAAACNEASQQSNEVKGPGTTACTLAEFETRSGVWPGACWRPFASSSPFYTPIPNNPRLLDNWQAMAQRILTTYGQRDSNGKEGIAATAYPSNLEAAPPDADKQPPSGNYVPYVPGEPTYYVDSSKDEDPQVILHCEWPTKTGPPATNCAGLDGKSIRVPAGARVEGGEKLAQDQGTDRHLTVIDRHSKIEYDLWQVKGWRATDQDSWQPVTAIPDQDGQLLVSWAGSSNVESGDGLADNRNLPEGQAPGHGTAAHFANLAGRLRFEELREATAIEAGGGRGVINHALFVVINCADGDYDGGKGYIAPAGGKGQSCVDFYAHLVEDKKGSYSSGRRQRQCPAAGRSPLA